MSYQSIFTGAQIDDAVAKSRSVSTALTTLFATDPTFGAVGDYSGDMTTAGTGTDNRALIQAALDAAHAQGASFGDVLKGTSVRVVLPRGKYYISARTDGMPSLVVPLKVDFDFSEAELFFQIPPRTYTANGITEPNPHWCGILVGQMGGLKVGRMQCTWGSDPTYGGTWYGMTLDAIRVYDSDIGWIRGNGNPHQIFNFRGAGIRYLACWNQFVRDLSIANTNYGIVMGYLGSGVPNYTRYRTGGLNSADNVSTSLFIDSCSFLNIGRTAVFTGAGGDWFNPAVASIFYGGLETPVVDGRPTQGGPIVVRSCAFENVAFGAVSGNAPTGALFIDDCRMEEVGDNSISLGVIYGNGLSLKINGVTWSALGTRLVGKASYTGPNTNSILIPNTFVRCDGVNVAPLLQNVFVSNASNSNCAPVRLSSNSRLPVLINYKCNATTQMQGTDSSVKSLTFPNDGGRIWSISTDGFTAPETVDGSHTAFTFANGFSPQKPKYVVVDGKQLEATDVSGTNWTWNSTTGVVTLTVAPTKSLRAFF